VYKLVLFEYHFMIDEEREATALLHMSSKYRASLEAEVRVQEGTRLLELVEQLQLLDPEDQRSKKLCCTGILNSLALLCEASEREEQLIAGIFGQWQKVMQLRRSPLDPPAQYNVAHTCIRSQGFASTPVTVQARVLELKEKELFQSARLTAVLASLPSVIANDLKYLTRASKLENPCRSPAFSECDHYAVRYLESVLQQIERNCKQAIRNGLYSKHALRVETSLEHITPNEACTSEAEVQRRSTVCFA
jgi:hypothetical protein